MSDDIVLNKLRNAAESFERSGEPASSGLMTLAAETLVKAQARIGELEADVKKLSKVDYWWPNDGEVYLSAREAADDSGLFEIVMSSTGHVLSDKFVVWLPTSYTDDGDVNETDVFVFDSRQEADEAVTNARAVLEKAE